MHKSIYYSKDDKSVPSMELCFLLNTLGAKEYWSEAAEYTIFHEVLRDIAY